MTASCEQIFVRPSQTYLIHVRHYCCLTIAECSISVLVVPSIVATVVSAANLKKIVKTLKNAYFATPQSNDYRPPMMFFWYDNHFLPLAYMGYEDGRNRPDNIVSATDV